MKKDKSYTIHITEEVAQMIEYNAREERRKPAELLALWVEDVARLETMKKTDRGTTWTRPTFTNDLEIILKN